MLYIVHLPADDSHEMFSLTCVLTRKQSLSAANFRWLFRGLGQFLWYKYFALLILHCYTYFPCLISVSIPWVLLNHI